MTDKRETVEISERRAALLAELLFQDLGATYIARPDTDTLPFDYLIGFANPGGGVNTIAVEIKARQKPVTGRYEIPKKAAAVIANSNPPVMLLVIDAKHNQLWYAWGAEIAAQSRNDANASIVLIELHEITAEEKSALKAHLTRVNRIAS